MQEEVENRTINLAISTTRLTARSKSSLVAEPEESFDEVKQQFPVR